MKKLEAKAEEFAGKTELRCKGWCHDIEIAYKPNLPSIEYFN
jgi:hypothetical protein